MVYKEMDAREMTNVSKVSKAKAGSSEKTKRWSFPDPLVGKSIDLEAVVERERAVQRAFEGMKAELMSTIAATLADFWETFNDRLKGEEDTCNDLVEHAEF